MAVVNLSNPLDNFPLVRSRDIDEVREALGRIYARPALMPRSNVAAVSATVNNCRLRHVSFAYGAYGASIGLQFPESEFFVQLLPIRGTSEFVCGNLSCALTPGSAALIPPDAAYSMRYSADYAHLVLRIEARALNEKLAALTGTAIVEPLRIECEPNFAHPAAHMLQRYVPLLIATLGQAHSPLPECWSAQTEQLLITWLLFAHRHNYSHLLDAEPPDALPPQVRQAEEYIAANAQRMVTLEELAELTGVSVFTLFRSFKKSRGYSPLEFVARQRARQARS